jgi:hypothetical protein
MKDELSNLDLNAVKSKYGNRFLELREMINRHDPLRLLENGAPDDEYDPQAKTIIVQLNTPLTKEGINDLVYREFLRWFGDHSVTGSREAYRALAAEIHEWTRGSIR